MQVICSYCRKDIGEKEPIESDLVSHGMCPECAEYFARQWEGLSLGEYLDRFDLPVLVMSEDSRVVAANQVMADLIGRKEREVHGLLGGEVMECVHARQEDGCGKGVHCRTCTVRNSITHTAETGENLHRVPCYVERDGGKDEFFISTVKLERSVQVLIEPGDPDGDPA